MASSEHSQTPPLTNEAPPTGIQTNPDSAATTEASSVSLPPPPRPSVWNEAALLRLRAGLDAALVVVVLLFAFLAASFPAFNPDFFSELAVGRLVLQGGYPFGADPFVYTAEGAYVVHHSWLFAVLMYGLYQLSSIGGAVVVIFKALLIALLSGIMLRAGRRAGQSLWIPAACTALAILVASPRLYLQSTCLSFLFLGVTLWLLTSVRPDGRHFWWLLPPLFALWVNCDAWFFLGPLTVALYLGGELLSFQAPFGREPQANADPLAYGSRLNQKRRGLLTLGIVFVLGVAACLLNPHGVHALTLPPEFGLTPAGGLLENDLQFHRLFVSPVNHDYYEPNFGWSVAGLAFWPLLLLSLASFAFVLNRAPWQRLLVWASFALMSLYNVHAIPFFAIVAGPIMALNCQDWASRLAAGDRPLTARLRNWSLGGQALTVLAVFALSIAAVPGLLQSQPRFHRLGWSVRVDPSLQAMAETIRAWRESGRLPDQPHWFNLHPEIATYLAYFAPGERVFFDRPGMLNFRDAAEDYLTVRQALKEGPSGQFSAEGELLGVKNTRQILRKHGVRFWIFDNFSGDEANDFARLVLFSSEEWILCHLDGHIAIFAWRDPNPSERQSPDSSQSLALDLKRAAFGPEAEPAPPRAAEPPLPLSWWQPYWDMWWRPAPRLSRDAETVALYDVRFRSAEQPRQNVLLSRAWQCGVAAAVISNSLSRGPIPNGLMALSWSYTYHDLFPAGTGQPARQQSASDQAAMLARYMYVNGQFMEPPSLYLAVRAARRALADDPDDATTYLRLGKVYQLLLGLPQEGRIPGSPPQMTAIRLTQTIAAFQDFLRLQSESEDAAQAFAAAQVHEVLYQLYAPPRGFGYIDAAVHHLRQALSKRAQAGPQLGETAAGHGKMLDSMSTQLTRLEGELDLRLKRYDLNAGSNSGFERAKAALELGLIETALTEMLEQAEDAKISNLSEWNTVKQVGEAALNLGRLDKARELLRDLDGKPAPPDRLDLYLRMAAARGDYAEADRLLADALQPPGQQAPARPADSVGLLLGRALLGEAQHVMGMTFMPWLTNNPNDIVQRTWLVENASDFWLHRWRHAAIIIGLSLSRQNAEWHLLRGWLALEAGRCAEARKQFEMARDLAVPLERWGREVDKLKAWLNPQREVPIVQELGARHIVLLDLSVRYLRWLEEKPTP